MGTGCHTAVAAERLARGCDNGRVSDLKDRLRTDLTSAIKARDSLRSSTLRMVLSAITNAEVAGKEQRELSDDDVVGVPAQLSEAEIKELVAATIVSLGAADEGMRAMGKVMGALQPQVKGRADGGAVAAEVRDQLG